MKGISIQTGRRRLLILWVAFCTALFALLMVQSIGGVYGSEVSDVWAWFLPAVVPTLSLMISLFVSNSGRSANEFVAILIFYMAFWGSFIYLLAVSIPLLIHPFLMQPLEAIHISGLWSGTFQGLVASTITVFFVMRKIEGSKNSETLQSRSAS